ncbi:MAG: hypothetical protein JO153_13400 [Solirubrobacterales bacterium]|nr:hypothetical protein [Solirubrobacterales bacterium]
MRRFTGALAAVAVAAAVLATTAGARVLRVGSYHGIRGQFSSIQAAVDAARPDDWVLIGPGDYKEHSARAPRGRPDLASGVLVQTRDIYLRGMNRNSVVIDGTRPGSARCSQGAAAQELGPRGKKGRLGLNGVMVWKANNVWVQNLTVCNYLNGAGDTGNEVWWNGGDGTLRGGIGGRGFVASYLNTTSTYFKDEATAAKYGLFSSNWSGGLFDRTYASNFNDSGYYIGACKQVCNQTIDHAWAEYSALGYSGSNSGGQLVVKNSEFDHNEDGFDTNSQNGDNPPPQNGACPGNKISPITHTHSCWVFMNNYVHDNNNPNVPAAGSAAAGPVGTGMSISGGRNDAVMNNRFVNNNAWGVILVPYIDSGPPCTGGNPNSPFGCLFEEWGDALLNNRFSHNGSYGHPSNGDFAHLNLQDGEPTNCYRGNRAIGGGPLSPDAAALQQAYPFCTGAAVPASSSNPAFLSEVLCNSQVQLNGQPSPCPTGQYPRRTRVVMHPLPKGLPTMPNPCRGVPANPWCPARKG